MGVCGRWVGVVWVAYEATQACFNYTALVKTFYLALKMLKGQQCAAQIIINSSMKIIKPFFFTPGL